MSMWKIHEINVSNLSYEIGHITNEEALFTSSLVRYQNAKKRMIGVPEMWRWLYLCVDCKEGQSLLSEHLHPGGRHEGGVSRDDVRGHCVTAAESAGGNGQTPHVSQQVIQTGRLGLCWLTCLIYVYHI